MAVAGFVAFCAVATLKTVTSATDAPMSFNVSLLILTSLWTLKQCRFSIKSLLFPPLHGNDLSTFWR
jgi:hypothetical protein